MPHPENQITIAVVDDNPANLFLLSEILSDYTVIQIMEPENVIPLIRQKAPDLIMLDIMMPDIDGFTIARELKNDSVLRDIPVIFVSACTSGEEVRKGLELGARDYIKKPYEDTEVLARVHRVLRENEEKRDLYYRATRDALTGLFNRSYFMDTVRAKLGMAIRNMLTFSIAMVDIDHFKMINDQHGHPAGDDVLRNLAGILKASCREYDIVARYGGEEFILYFEGITRDQAGAIVDRIRIKTGGVPMGPDNGITVTFSSGIADSREITGTDSQSMLDELISMADKRLYSAKHSGRNMVLTAG